MPLVTACLVLAHARPLAAAACWTLALVVLSLRLLGTDPSTLVYRYSAGDDLFELTWAPLPCLAALFVAVVSGRYFVPLAERRLYRAIGFALFFGAYLVFHPAR